MIEIPITQGYFALIDDEDYDLVMQHAPWNYNRGYARHAYRVRGEGRNDNIFMQNLIMHVEKGVDHINRNRLDNQKHNLRVAPIQQRFNKLVPQRDYPRGVRPSGAASGGYRAGIKFNGIFEELGTFDSVAEAYSAYKWRYYEINGELPPEWGDEPEIDYDHLEYVYNGGLDQLRQDKMGISYTPLPTPKHGRKVFGRVNPPRTRKEI